jgi:hypothetical protein
MARGRMLSKSISLDEKVDALSDDTARLLFTWMIPHLDCEGRMYADPQVFKAIVAPRRNYTLKKIENCLAEMEKLALIFRYSVNGNTFLWAPNFEKHQIGLRKDKEAQSQIPSPEAELGRSKDGVRTELVPPKRKESKVIEEKIFYADNVSLTAGEYQKLIDKIGNELAVRDWIEELSNYKKSKGKRYKDDCATILNWWHREQKKGAQYSSPDQVAYQRL